MSQSIDAVSEEELKEWYGIYSQALSMQRSRLARLTTCKFQREEIGHSYRTPVWEVFEAKMRTLESDDHGFQQQLRQFCVLADRFSISLSPRQKQFTD